MAGKKKKVNHKSFEDFDRLDLELRRAPIKPVKGVIGKTMY